MAETEMVERGLREALERLERVSVKAWDRVGSGLMIMEDRNIAEYDEACRLARIALGKPLYGDNGEFNEEDTALSPKE